LTLAQASRISGVNPADISILLVYLEQGKNQAGIEFLKLDLSKSSELGNMGNEKGK